MVSDKRTVVVISSGHLGLRHGLLNHRRPFEVGALANWLRQLGIPCVEWQLLTPTEASLKPIYWSLICFFNPMGLEPPPFPVKDTTQLRAIDVNSSLVVLFKLRDCPAFLPTDASRPSKSRTLCFLSSLMHQTAVRELDQLLAEERWIQARFHQLRGVVDSATGTKQSWEELSWRSEKNWKRLERMELVYSMEIRTEHDRPEPTA